MFAREEVEMDLEEQLRKSMSGYDEKRESETNDRNGGKTIFRVMVFRNLLRLLQSAQND